MSNLIWRKKFLKKIGAECADFRTDIGIKQKEIAKYAHCSVENISAFEHGRSSSLILLLAYMRHGMSYERLIEVDVDDV